MIFIECHYITTCSIFQIFYLLVIVNNTRNGCFKIENSKFCKNLYISFKILVLEIETLSTLKKIVPKSQAISLGVFSILS